MADESFEVEQDEVLSASKSFVFEAQSIVSDHNLELQQSIPHQLQHKVLSESPVFEVDCAYEHVVADAYIGGNQIYRPYLLALSYSKMLPRKYVDKRKNSFTDQEGTKWKKV